MLIRGSVTASWARNAPVNATVNTEASNLTYALFQWPLHLVRINDDAPLIGPWTSVSDNRRMITVIIIVQMITNRPEITASI